jgi:hypothetical protein
MFKLLGSILVAIIFSLLIWQRFDVPPSLHVHVTAVEGESQYVLNETFKRGRIIETSDDYLYLTIGDDAHVFLDKKTKIELNDLNLEGPTIRFYRGRLLITSNQNPVWITTNQSESTLIGGTATLVNYDFLEEVHIIPLKGTIQLFIKETGEYLSTPFPISVHEGYDVWYEQIDPTLDSESIAPFYQWVKAQR